MSGKCFGSFSACMYMTSKAAAVVGVALERRKKGGAKNIVILMVSFCFGM